MAIRHIEKLNIIPLNNIGLNMSFNQVPNLSAVPERVPEFYGKLSTALASTTPEEKQAVCLLTLTTPTENDKFFDWISVPNEGKTPNVYIISGEGGFGKYFDRFAGVVPDPMKIYSNLLFMSKRLNRMRSVCDTVKQTKTIEIDTKFRNEILGRCYSKWINKLPIDPITIDYAVTVSIMDMERTGILYNGMKSGDAYFELKAHRNEPGAFLLRNSSMSNTKGDSTVFTITCIREDSSFYSVRLIDLHGIGIYVTTAVCDGKVEIFRVAEPVVRSAERKQILAAVNYKPPNYACIIDLLIDFDKRGYIKLDKIVVSDSVTMILNELIRPFEEETKLLLKEKKKKEEISKVKVIRQACKKLHSLIENLIVVAGKHRDLSGIIIRNAELATLNCLRTYELTDAEISDLDDPGMDDGLSSAPGITVPVPVTTSTSLNKQKIKIDNAITNLAEIDTDITELIKSLSTV